jgi:hypothetical protein
MHATNCSREHQPEFHKQNKHSKRICDIRSDSGFVLTHLMVFFKVKRQRFFQLFLLGVREVRYIVTDVVKFQGAKCERTRACLFIFMWCMGVRISTELWIKSS